MGGIGSLAGGFGGHDRRIDGLTGGIVSPERGIGGPTKGNGILDVMRPQWPDERRLRP